MVRHALSRLPLDADKLEWIARLRLHVPWPLMKARALILTDLNAICILCKFT